MGLVLLIQVNGVTLGVILHYKEMKKSPISQHFIEKLDFSSLRKSARLYMEEMSFAVLKGHLLENQKGLTLEVLKTPPSILLPENYYVRQLINKTCNDLGFSPNEFLK